MKKALSLILLTLTTILATTTEYVYDGDLLQLTTDNIQQAYEDFGLIFVFYDAYTKESHLSSYSNDEHAKTTEDQLQAFSEAARIVTKANKHVKFGVMSSQDFFNSIFYGEHGGSGPSTMYCFYFSKYKRDPSLLWHVRTDDVPSGSDMILSATSLISYMMIELGQKSIETHTVRETSKLIKGSDVSVLYLGDSSSSHFDEYLKMTASFKYITFMNSNSTEVTEKYIAPEIALMVFNDHGNETHIFDGVANTENYKQFILDYQFPTVSVVDLEFRRKLLVDLGFKGSKNVIFLIRKDKEDNAEAESIFRRAAKPHRKDFLFAICNDFSPVSYLDSGARFTSLNSEAGLKEQDLPALMIMEVAENDRDLNFKANRRFKLDSEITEESLDGFIRGYKEGKLEPFLRSEDLKDVYVNENIQPVVGSTWEEVVMDEAKDVLIMLQGDHEYSPDVFMYSDYTGLFREYGSPGDLVVAEISLQNNDVKGMEYEGPSSIKLYPKGAKTNPVEFEGKVELETMRKFLKDNGVALKGKWATHDIEL